MTHTATIPILNFVLASMVSCAAAAVDIRRRQIPDGLSLTLLVIGVVTAGCNRGWPGFVDALIGAALGFAVFLLPYLLGGMGGGDVKLMAASGALTGIEGVLPALTLVAITGAGTAVLFLAFCRLRGQAFCPAIPYAPAITIGSLLVAASQTGVR